MRLSAGSIEIRMLDRPGIVLDMAKKNVWRRKELRQTDLRELNPDVLPFTERPKYGSGLSPDSKIDRVVPSFQLDAGIINPIAQGSGSRLSPSDRDESVTGVVKAVNTSFNLPAWRGSVFENQPAVQPIFNLAA